MDKQIKANEIECSRPNCKKKGYKWICADPDIEAFVLCKKHLIEFEMNLMNILKPKRIK